MGKVKEKQIETLNEEIRVSIPYGKGKEKIQRHLWYVLHMYQFPMGKVKLNP